MTNATEASMLQELADRQEIIDLLSRLGRVLDERRVDEGLTVFTVDVFGQFPDTHYEGVDSLMSRVRDGLVPYVAVQHVITNVMIDLDGNAASVRANLIATHVHSAHDLTSHFDVGCTYTLAVVRTPDGWRISRLQLNVVWINGDPGGHHGNNPVAPSDDTTTAASHCS